MTLSEGALTVLEMRAHLRRRLLYAALLLVVSPFVSPLGYAAPASKAGESRLALVIGNSAYEMARLRNPRNDARDMAEALRSVGFEVMLETDVDEAQMYRAIRAFGEALKRRQGVGLFYYAGHGMQVRGRNYLIPLGADIRAEDEVPYQSIDAGLVLSKMEAAGNRLNIAILDACRNNPFARSFRSSEQGLARMEAPSGTLIAYATAPGRVAVDGTGRNSPYTRHLLETLEQSGLTVEQVFKQVREGVMAATDGVQVPWESSSLVGEFYFEPPAEAVAAATPPTRPAFIGKVDPKALDLAFWESIKNSANPANFREYLKRFPEGVFSGLARNRLSELEADGRSEEKKQSDEEGRLAIVAPRPKESERAPPKPRKVDEPFKVAILPFSTAGLNWRTGAWNADLADFAHRFLKQHRRLSLVDVDSESFAARLWRNGGQRPDVQAISAAGRSLGLDGALTYSYHSQASLPHLKILTVFFIDLAHEKAYEAEGSWRGMQALTERVVADFFAGHGFGTDRAESPESSFDSEGAQRQRIEQVCTQKPASAECN